MGLLQLSCVLRGFRWRSGGPEQLACEQLYYWPWEASEKQSHQNTARLHGWARKRWDIFVRRRCSRRQTAPLQTSFTLNPITACLVTCSSSRCWWMETAASTRVTPNRSDRCPPLFLQRVNSASTHPTAHDNHVLFQMTAVFVPMTFNLDGWACVCLCSVALERAYKQRDIAG